MPYAIELTFDDRADKSIRQGWSSLHRIGIDPLNAQSSLVRPHVSLAVCQNLDHATLSEQLANVCSRHSNLAVTMSYVGMFPSAARVLFLGVTVTAELLEIHAAVHEVLRVDNSPCWPVYLPDIWVPHCTMAMGVQPENIGVGLETCLAMPLPLVATVHSMSIAEVSGFTHWERAL